jgi:hypothetical protein
MVVYINILNSLTKMIFNLAFIHEEYHPMFVRRNFLTLPLYPLFFCGNLQNNTSQLRHCTYTIYCKLHSRHDYSWNAAHAHLTLNTIHVSHFKLFRKIEDTMARLENFASQRVNKHPPITSSMLPSRSCYKLYFMCNVYTRDTYLHLTYIALHLILPPTNENTRI